MHILDFSFLFTGDYARELLSGALTTLELFVLAWFLAMVLAVALAVVGTLKFAPARVFVAVYVAYHRNVPLLVQLLFWYFGVPMLLPSVWSTAINNLGGEFIYALIALVMNSAAYMSEDIRSGLRAIPTAQFEAARAMGFTPLGALIWTIIPQAWRIALPALIGDTLSLFKSTAIAAVIGVGDLTYYVRQIENETFRVFEIFLVASVFYFAITIPLMLFGNAMARRVSAM
jgi:polar amino acid transport system permease protein